MLARLPVLAVVMALLVCCAKPPPDAYIQATTTGTMAAVVSIGNNAAGEACSEHPAGAAELDIFCGTWRHPSAYVRRGAAVAPGGLAALAANSPWRAGLDTRFQCNPPTATSILGGQPAEALQCVRRIGGWPQVAMVADVGGTAYYADGVLPALPVLERGIGVLSGRIRPGTPTPVSEADSLFAARLAAQSFRSGDIGQYEDLMSAGTIANLAENFANAELAFRAALALQQKALGRDDPNSVAALTHLALQISDQGRYAEADGLFARAERLAPHAADQVAPARLLHYRALHALNQGHDEEALALARQAEAAYSALLPPEMLSPAPTPSPTARARQLLIDPTQRAALIGVLETRRYRAIVLRDLHRPAESEAALRSASVLAAANGLRQPILTARLFRTAGATAGATGAIDAAVAGLSRSAADFRLALPGARPIAETELLRADQLARQGRGADALLACREAATVLGRIHAGIRPELLEPCLGIYATQAEANAADRQHLLGEMFEAAQLAQSTLTGRQIALAAARLGANARDPRVGAAIRRSQDARRVLADLYRRRDTLAAERASGQPVPGDAAALDKRIRAAQSGLLDADQELQEAAPNYGQLVQEVASAADVRKALGPDEAFAAIMLTPNGGWTFVLRNGSIAASRVPGGLARMSALVARLRAGAEPTTAALPRYDVDAARAIYDDTLGPLAAQFADAKALVVAPSGPLLAIPFSVLLTGPADPDHLGQAPWLLRRITIAHVPAPANFVALRKIAAGSRAAHPWFGFGDFRPVSLAQAERSFPGSACADSAKLFAGLPPLPYSKRELAAARLLVGAAPQDEMLGQAFTAAAVRNAELAGFRILHFATHALLPAELRCQSEPAIVTSDPRGAVDASGALLSASEITGLKLDADMVILSACNSGGPGGEGTGGESLSGLARAFFYAGARSLLVTHWSVNDQAAAYLIADTLRRLRAGEGGGAAGALRNAQLGMLADAGKGLPAQMAHPFFWGPFALIGDGTIRPFGAQRVASRSGPAGL